MKKRASDKIPVNIKISLLYDNSLCSGVVTNLSEKSMCINSGMRILLKPKDELLITFKEKARIKVLLFIHKTVERLVRK